MLAVVTPLVSLLRSPWLVRALAAAGLCALAETLVLVVISPLARGDATLVLATWMMLSAVFVLPACVLALPLAFLARFGRAPPLPAVTLNLAGVFTLAVLAVALRLVSRAEAVLTLEFPAPVALAMTFVVVIVLVLAGALGFLLERALRPYAGALEARLSARRLLAFEGLLGLFVTVWVAQAGVAAVHDHRLLPLAGPCVVVLALLVVWGLDEQGSPRGVRVPALIGIAVLVAGGLAGSVRADARFLVASRVATTSAFLDLGRALSDRDGDGAGRALWGSTDCAGGDPDRAPDRREIPGNGVDEDCRGGDGALALLPVAQAPQTGPWAACVQESADEPRSVLLITVDTLRADVVSPERTPALAALARRSAWFTRAYSQSTSTRLSLYGLLGGRHVSDAPNGTFARADSLPPSGGLLEAFGKAGVRRLAVPFLSLPDVLESGFDTISWGRRDPDPDGAKYAMTSSSVTDTALDLLARQRAPFFLWAHYLDPHAPFLPISRELFPQPEGSDYEREVAYTLLQVGRLLDGLAASPLAESTIVVVTADHGEELGQRGRHGHGPDLFESSVHVPLALYVPGCPAVLVDEPVAHADVAPALALLTGTNVPRPYSLLDAIARRERPLPVVSETGFQGKLARAVIDERYKLVIDVRGGGKLLFDLERDPEETQSVYGQSDDVTAHMESLYQRWLDRPPLPGASTHE